MSFPAGTYITQIVDPAVRAEFEQLYSLFQGFLAAQHKENGAHNAVTFASLTSDNGDMTTEFKAGSSTGEATPIPVLKLRNRSVSGIAQQIWTRLNTFVGIAQLSANVNYDGSNFTPDDTGKTSWLMRLDTGASTGTPGFGIHYNPANAGTYFSMSRLFFVDTSGALYERKRTTPIGEWTTVAHSGTNYTASGAMTWTVDLADQVTYAYKLVGKSLTVSAWVATTTVAGVVATQLNVAIPGGFVAAKAMGGACGVLLDNGVGVAGTVSVAAAGTVIVVQRADAGNFTASANNTQVRFTFEFEIQ